MRRIGAYEAKTHLPRLLDDVANGEAISITKHGVAIAVLAPASTRPTLTAHEAIAGLRAFRRAHPRDGLSLRELIDEGRRLCSSWTPRWPRRSGRSRSPTVSAPRSGEVASIWPTCRTSGSCWYRCPCRLRGSRWTLRWAR